MITTNPFSELSSMIPAVGMQAYVVLMLLLVVGGTILDVLHKKSARYFFANARKSEAARERPLSSSTKASVARKTLAEDILTSAEFSNQRRRLAHLLTMYGFVLFVVTTIVMVFAYPTPAASTPGIWPLLWHLGALMVCIGGYWFWFVMRVDVAAEGHPWYRVARADLFVLSLLATATLALVWSFLQSAGAATAAKLFFGLFLIASTTLFGTVLWSKFAHMFFKPAAAFQKRFAEADGSRDNLPAPADKPKEFGLGIKRELPQHY
jgi:hypothetical protein